jgi:Ca2+/Na+ antiporter
LTRGRSSLAIGNIIGAAISNILGAFSLGLLFFERGETIKFDRSSRVYSLLLLALTTLVTPIAYFPAHVTWSVCGSVLITIFGIYLFTAGIAIGKGILTPPEDSDDDSDSENDSYNASSEVESSTPSRNPDLAEPAPDATSIVQSDGGENLSNGDARALVEAQSPPPEPRPRRKSRRLRYHVSYLLLGFLSICLAGYVLSGAATNITDQFGVSDVLFGVIILAIATTLPEKFIAVMSGHRGSPGILVANTVGSNIFLLALCIGVIMVSSRGSLDGGNVTIVELCTLWASTLAVTITVWFGERISRYIGALMLAAYVAFIVVEFTVVHKVVN